MKNNIDSSKFEELIDALQIVEDPRVVGRSSHNLVDILVISILAIVCGAESITDMVTFGRSKESWLRKLIELPHGIPSHDTFARVLSMINVEQLEAIFCDWVKLITGSAALGTISVDGKTTKGTYGRFNDGTRPLHIVSVYSHIYGLTLAETDSKSAGNAETQSAIKCLQSLDIKGVTVLLDAGIGQKAAIDQIISQGGGYIVPIKRNSKGSYQELIGHFETHRGQVKVSRDNSHGRKEYRECRLLSASKLSDSFKTKWPEAKSVFMVYRLIETKDMRYALQKRDPSGKNYYELNPNRGGYKSQDSQIFYVSSDKLTSNEALAETRRHWGIENNLHWTLDVAFREDQWTVRSKKLAQKLSLIRKIALNLIRLSKTTGSVRSRIKRAGWDNSFLEKLVFGKEF